MLCARVLVGCALLQLLVLAVRVGRHVPEDAREAHELASIAADVRPRVQDSLWNGAASSAAAAPRATQQEVRSSGDVFGIVADAEGRGLPARVVLRYQDGRHVEGQCDPEGRFRFGNIEGGAVSVEAMHSGHRAQRREDVEPGSEVRIALERGSDLRGRVVDLANRGVADAQVEVRGSAGYLQSCRTDSDGRYEIPRPAAGMLAFTIVAPGYDVLETSRVPVRVEDDGIEDWVLKAGVVFFARIVDEEGAPVAGAKVAIQPAGMMATDDLRRRAFPAPATTGSDGSFHCDGLPSGGAILLISAPGFIDFEQTLHIDEGVRGEQRFVLDRGRVVRGKVQSGKGTPAVGWQVSLEQLSELGQWVEVGARQATDATGRFQFPGAPIARPLRVAVWQGRTRAKESRRIEASSEDATPILLELD